VVELDGTCRRQQVGEGWPDTRKAQALKACFEGEVSPVAPASILRRHPNATIYLDQNSAALLSSSLRTYA
jgi:hypothetical protein